MKHRSQPSLTQIPYEKKTLNTKRTNISLMMNSWKVLNRQRNTWSLHLAYFSFLNSQSFSVFVWLEGWRQRRLAGAYRERNESLHCVISKLDSKLLYKHIKTGKSLKSLLLWRLCSTSWTVNSLNRLFHPLLKVHFQSVPAYSAPSHRHTKGIKQGR